MKKYIFLWQNSTGYSWVYGKRKRTDPYPIPIPGSFAVRPVDGRMNINSILCEAIAFAKRTPECVGFSVGYITPHDPENKYIQSIIKFTEI